MTKSFGGKPNLEIGEKLNQTSNSAAFRAVSAFWSILQRFQRLALMLTF